jgi:hypothetical protein
MVYVDDAPEKVGLVADRERICKPDLLVECRESASWYSREGPDPIGRHHEMFKPRLGTFVVTRRAQEGVEFGSGIRVVCAGFARSRLSRVAGRLLHTSLGPVQG